MKSNLDWTSVNIQWLIAIEIAAKPSFSQKHKNLLEHATRTIHL